MTGLPSNDLSYPIAIQTPRTNIPFVGTTMTPLCHETKTYSISPSFDPSIITINDSTGAANFDITTVDILDEMPSTEITLFVDLGTTTS